jgi:hypothetical protein
MRQPDLTAMDGRPAPIRIVRRVAASALRGGVFACLVLVTSALAVAQDRAKPSVPEDPGFFATIGRWFDHGIDNINAGARNVRDRFLNLRQEAGIAAQSTVDTAKDAADVMGRIPGTRVIAGHQQCRTAPNGAPDCVAAANAICGKQGFKSGKSVDMTTAEVCPAEVYLAGRNSGPECHTETFVSRALCQ